MAGLLATAAAGGFALGEATTPKPVDELSPLTSLTGGLERLENAIHPPETKSVWATNDQGFPVCARPVGKDGLCD